MGAQPPPSDEDVLIPPQPSTTTPSLQSQPSLTAAGSDALPLLLRIILGEDESGNEGSDDGAGGEDYAEATPKKSNNHHVRNASNNRAPNASNVDNLRHLPLTTALQSLSTYDLLRELELLDEFRRTCDNLYQRVRALFFLYAAHRFHLPERRAALERKKKKEKQDGDGGGEDIGERDWGCEGQGGSEVARSGEDSDEMDGDAEKTKKEEQEEEDEHDEEEDEGLWSFNYRATSDRTASGSLGTATSAEEGAEEERATSAANEELAKGVEGGADEAAEPTTVVCPRGYAALLDRRFEEAIDRFLASVPLSPSAMPVAATSNYPNDAANEDEFAAPRRTSLVSLLGRIDSSTESVFSRGSSFFQYSNRTSCVSTLEGEDLILYSAVAASGWLGTSVNSTLSMPGGMDTSVTSAPSADGDIISGIDNVGVNSPERQQQQQTNRVTWATQPQLESTLSMGGASSNGESRGAVSDGAISTADAELGMQQQQQQTNSERQGLLSPTPRGSTQHQEHRQKQPPAAKANVEQQFLLLPSDATSSALAKAYRSLAFQTLADQVKSSVRSHPGNEWMFNLSSASEQPLRWSEELLATDDEGRPTAGPSLLERTPVRMDLSHSCWSDIFFLGMDYPEAARVINCSVDLAVQKSGDNDGDGGAGDSVCEGEVDNEQREGNGSSDAVLPTPPIECRLRLTTADPGTIRLTSVDLKSTVLLTHVSQVFNYGADYLGLLKAGLVASGIVPSGLEKACEVEDVPIRNFLAVMMPSSLTDDSGESDNDECPYGLELTTNVHNIPKGSRLAVSTNLLGSIIAVAMRATSQTSAIAGTLLEPERRLVAARAILGEWLGGSGGGWQDSGGLWPGLKLIHGVKSTEGDPEWGTSRGRLLPRHRLLRGEEAPAELLKKLEQSLVLVHGGMAQNVGPILEMVTEKYLLREEEEWHARHRAMEILDDLLVAFKGSDIKAIARLVTENFFGPIRTVIPWATNLYTETLISRVQQRFRDEFWGFWMLGGMSGGGMGFIFDPSAKPAALKELGNIMLQTKTSMEHSLPFAMDPVVFDYRVNEYGTVAELINNAADDADKGGADGSQANATCIRKESSLGQDLEELLREGFDKEEQEQIRSDLQNGVIGLSRNRLPPESKLEDVATDDVITIDKDSISKGTHARGMEALASGKVAVVTLAAGVGSRWTQGAGVVKALHPYCCIGGKHRTFLDVHLAKNRRVSAKVGTPLPHVFTTSWMTDAPIASYVESLDEQLHNIPIYVSKGRSIGLRMIPMVRDLKFLWEEQTNQRLDEQAEKVRDSVHSALMGWAESNGEGSDYTDNVPKQCLCPVGHWYEVPNLLLNGTLAKLLRERPQLTTLMLHNIDTIGADVDAAILGKFLETGTTLAYEVVPRCIDDMGGGLCRVDGKPRLVEGLALPSEDDELKFSYYNSLTTWIDIDKLLSNFGLKRKDILEHSEKIPSAINAFSRRLPTYVTIKDVKKRWGKGQEDVHPVAQYEKLWGDMSSVEGVECSYFVVSRLRGQQLKDPAQLDGWSRDGSAAYLDSICSWQDDNEA